MAWQRLAGTWRLVLTHSCTVGGVTPNAEASLLMPPAADTARSIGVMDSMPRLLGNTYDLCKALPKIFLCGPIEAMEISGHMGQKLQHEAARLGLKPSQVAQIFGVKPPSVYDWYAHGRIHKKHYPVLVEKFGKPLEWWLDFGPKAAQPVADYNVKPLTNPIDLSPEALLLARLFDMIPARDVLTRTQAQTICGQAIIDLLQRISVGQAQRAEDNKTPST